MNEYFDEDGYPTKEALEKISKWEYTDLYGLMEFIKSLWHFGDMMWRKEHKFDENFDRWYDEYYCSTGGWSGNESIIHAMQENRLCWHFVWYSTRRGGHYIFRIEEDRESKKTENCRM